MSDPITAIIVAVKAVVTAFVAAYKASAIVRAIVLIVAMVAVSAISQALIGQSTPRNNQGQELALKLDPTMPRQIASGATATGGSLLFSKTFTEDPAVPSGKLIRVIALSDRPAKLSKITEGSQNLTFHGAVLPYTLTGFNEVDQHRSLGGLVRMYVYFVPGSDDPFGDAIAANGLSWLRDNCGWAPTDRGVGMCWAIVAYNYDPDAFPQGEPSIVFHLNGNILVDPRLAYQVFEEAWFPTSLAVVDSTKPFMPSADMGWDTQAGSRVWVNGRKLIWLGWHQEITAATVAAQADPSYCANFTAVPIASPLAYTLRVGSQDVAPGADLYAFQWLSQRVLEMDMDTKVVTMVNPFDPTFSWTGGKKLALCNDWGWAQQQTIDQRNGDMIIAGDVLNAPDPTIGGQVVYFLRRDIGYKLHMNMFDPMGDRGSGIETMGGAQLWIESVGPTWTIVSVYHHAPWTVTDLGSVQLVPTQDQSAEITAKQKKCYRYMSPPWGYNNTLMGGNHAAYFYMELNNWLYCAAVQQRPGGNINTDYRFQLWRISLAAPFAPATSADADGGWTNITPFIFPAGPVGLQGNPWGASESSHFLEPAPDNTNLMVMRNNGNQNGDRIPPYSWIIESAVTWIAANGSSWSDFVFIGQHMNADWTIGTAGARYTIDGGVQKEVATQPFDLYKTATSTYTKSTPELRYFKTVVTDTTGVDDYVISAYHFTYGAAPTLVGFWPSSLWDQNNPWPDPFLPKEHALYHALDFNTAYSTPQRWYTQYYGKSLHYDAVKNEAWDFSRQGIDSNYAPASFMDYDPRFVYTSSATWSPFYNQYDVRAGYPWARLTFGPSGGTTDPSRVPTENIAIQAYNLLKGYYTLGTLILGAQATEDDFNASNLLTAFNICDELVTLHAPDLRGRTAEPRYSGGLMISAANATQEALKAFQLAMDGQIYDCGGKITILPGKARTPILDLTDEDIIWAEEQSWQPYADLSSLWNVVTGSYVPEDQNYQQSTFPTQHNPTYQADDGGQRIVMNLDYAAVHSNEGIQRITKRVLEAGRFQGLVGFVGPLSCWELEQGDWFTLTSIKWGFTTKSFEVKAISFAKDLKVAIVGQEVSASIDTWDPATMLQDFSVTGGSPHWGMYTLNITDMITGLYSSAAGDWTQAQRVALTSSSSNPGSDYILNAGGTLISSITFNVVNYSTTNGVFIGGFDFVLPTNIRRSEHMYLELGLQITGALAANGWLADSGLKVYATRANGKMIGEALGNPAYDGSTYLVDTYACEVLTPFLQESMLLRDDSDGDLVKIRIPTNAGVRFNPVTSTYTAAPELKGGDKLTIVFTIELGMNVGSETRPWWSRGASGIQFAKGNVPFDVSYLSGVSTWRSGIAAAGPDYVGEHSSPQVLAFDSENNAGVVLKEVSNAVGLLSSSGMDSSVHFYRRLSPDWPTATDVWFKVLCRLDGTGTPDNTGGFNVVKVTAINVVTGATYAGVAYHTADISDKKIHQLLFNIPHIPTTGSGNLTAGDWLAFVIEFPTKVTSGTGKLMPFIFRATADVFPDNSTSHVHTNADDWDLTIFISKARVLVPVTGAGGVLISDVVNPGGLDPTITTALTITAGQVIAWHATLGSHPTQVYPNTTVPADLVKILGIASNTPGAGVIATWARNGSITHVGWTWTIGQPVYVADGATGGLTQTVPTAGWVHIIGVATAADTIRVTGQLFPISTKLSE